MLPLSRSDGNTFIPVNSCLLASAKESNLIRHICNIVKRTIAGKRIALAQSKVAEAMLTLLDTAATNSDVRVQISYPENAINKTYSVTNAQNSDDEVTDSEYTGIITLTGNATVS